MRFPSECSRSAENHLRIFFCIFQKKSFWSIHFLIFHHLIFLKQFTFETILFAKFSFPFVFQVYFDDFDISSFLKISFSNFDFFGNDSCPLIISFENFKFQIRTFQLQWDRLLSHRFFVKCCLPLSTVRIETRDIIWFLYKFRIAKSYICQEIIRAVLRI